LAYQGEREPFSFL